MIWIVAFSLTISMILVGLLFPLIVRFDANKAVLWDQDWEIRVNDETVYQGVLSEYKFDGLGPGDEVVLYSHVPGTSLHQPALALQVMLSRFTVVSNNMEYYSFGMDIPEDDFVPTAYHEVPLSGLRAGDPLLIRIYPAEKNAFTNIGNLRLIDRGTLNELLLFQAPQTLLIGDFLLMLGFVSLVVGVTISLVEHALSDLLAVGAMSIAAGFWTLSCAKLTQMFFTNYALNTYVEFISLYILLTFFAMMETRVARDARGRRAMWTTTCTFALFDIAVTVLHFANIVHIPRTLPICHVAGVVQTVVFIACCGQKIKDQPTSKKLFYIAFLEILVFGISELVRYNVQKYLIADDANSGTTFLQYGFVAMVTLLVYSYIASMEERTAESAKAEVWKNLAFTDQLTGMKNRAYMSDRFNTEIPGPYAIMNIDLNFLKRTNDTYGHLEGDRLIKDFAQILMDVFGPYAEVARMGGDEFSVVFTDTDKERIEAAIQEMRSLEERRSQGRPYTIQCAYGVAYSDELASHAIRDVFHLADNRMYECKQTQKAGR